VEVNQHAHHRSALPLAVVLAAAGSLRHYPRLLQNQPRPVVRQPKPMRLRGLLVEMANREVRINFSLQTTHLVDHLRRDPKTPRGSCPASIDKLSESFVLHRVAHPPHVPWRHAKDLSRLDPRDLTADRLQHHLLLRHHPGLPGHPPLDGFHRAPVAHPGRTSSSVYDPDIFIVCDNPAGNSCSKIEIGLYLTSAPSDPPRTPKGTEGALRQP